MDHHFKLTNQWNGQPINDHQTFIEVKFSGKMFASEYRLCCTVHCLVMFRIIDISENGMQIEINAPFFDDPPPPDGKAGSPYYQLWDYEVNKDD